jgi:hypothetical protein
LLEFVRVARANPTTRIHRIIGFSDCVGQERNNRELRLGRAWKVFDLLHQLIGSGPHWNDFKPKREDIVAAAAGDYIADNSTAEGRAQNRGALIVSTRVVSMKPEVIQPPPRTTDVDPPDFIARILQRAGELYQRTDKWHQFGWPLKSEGQRRRILCLVSQMSQPQLDDRYLDRRAVEMYAGIHGDPRMTAPQYISATKMLLPDDAVRLRLKRTDGTFGWTCRSSMTPSTTV